MNKNYLIQNVNKKQNLCILQKKKKNEFEKKIKMNINEHKILFCRSFSIFDIFISTFYFFYKSTLFI